MRTAGRLTLFVLLFALAASLAASSVWASTGVRYGIQDDAWLEFGPGTLNQRLATFKRLGVPLVRFTLRWNEVARQRPKQPTSPRDRAYDWRRPAEDEARRLGNSRRISDAFEKIDPPLDDVGPLGRHHGRLGQQPLLRTAHQGRANGGKTAGRSAFQLDRLRLHRRIVRTPMRNAQLADPPSNCA